MTTVMFCISLDLKEKTAVLKGKMAEQLEVVSEIEDKEHHKEVLIQRIEKLKKDQAKNKECVQYFISSNLMTDLLYWCSLVHLQSQH